MVKWKQRGGLRILDYSVHVRSSPFFWKSFKKCFKTPLPPNLFTFGWLEIDPLSHCTLWEHRADHSYENLIVSHADGSEIDVYRFHVNVSLLQWRQPTVTRFLSLAVIRPCFFSPLGDSQTHNPFESTPRYETFCNMTVFKRFKNDTCVVG